MHELRPGLAARVNAALLQRARKTIVLADATKIGRVALAQVCPMTSVDLLITDERAAEAQIEQIRERDCEVTLV